MKKTISDAELRTLAAKNDSSGDSQRNWLEL